MRIMELMQMALKTVSANWMRTLLTMLGVIIGVSSVVTLVAIGKGTSAQIAKQYENMGTNLLVVNLLNQGRATQLNYSDIMTFEQFPEIAAIAPTVSSSLNVKYDTTQESYSVLGSNERYMSILKASINKGRFITEADLDLRTNVAVLGATVSKELFGTADPLDKIININGFQFTVVGLLNTKGSSIGGTSADDSVIIPLTTAQRQLSLGAIRTTYVEATTKEDITTAQSTLTSFLTYKFKSSSGFRFTNQDQLLSASTEASNTLTSQLVSVACISLLVGGIGIMNIMLVTVSERTREIGIRKSIGAKRKNILLQFLFEAVVISGLGGLIGLLIGVGLAKAWPYFNPKQMTVVSFDISMYAFLFSVLVGVIFGLYPANKASKLRPIDALRTD
ncbi:ABC transporter permease [Paenibacillus radicis (ex Xue et al. 2023)]|uniref:ABC transporter permease n=1 Tax=Paenibacillus radicis (ex Xue et al. 2023) TaxID=2972489 RepID=A0ABT1YD95_9BACL|nr:ABC transporter permease [Paenibacillus radicis (ex Xue et al. 2023)]MCR8630897.1 ABC transporter permease [Paenibacillus radicis (ex Xue et al. 2023)]